MSARDLQVLRLAAAGCPAKEIADELRISPRTVEFHLEKARRDYGARSTTEAVYLMVKRESVKIPTRRASAPTQELWQVDVPPVVPVPRTRPLRLP